MELRRKPSVKASSRQSVEDVLRAVQRGVRTSEEIRELTGKSQCQVARALGRLMREGKVMGVRDEAEMIYLPMRVLFQGDEAAKRRA